jgi:hypothetical protein
MAYTTKAKVDAQNNISVPQTVFDDLLASVKAYIDRYCGKTFEAVSETRYYDSKGGRCIVVDPFVGTAVVETLNVDGTTYATLVVGQANDYLLYPLNSTTKWEIRLTQGVASFRSGSSVVKITATFGYSTTAPKDIELAASRLIAGLYKDGQSNLVKSETLGDYSVSYDTVASRAAEMGISTILDSYRDIEL